MTNKKFWLGLLVLLVLGMAFLGCDDDNANITPQTVTYTGTANGVTYTLKITQNTDNRSVYSPVGGDRYELTVGLKKSNGTVVSFLNGVFSLRPSNAQVSFTVTVSGNSISDISGTITWDNNETETGPGSINGEKNNDDGGIFTLIDIPSEYNGKYAMFQCEALHGFISWNNDEGYTLPQISDARVNIPLWLLDGNEEYGRYSGNQTLQNVLILLYNNAKYDDNHIIAWQFSSVTFSSGNATKSWNDGTEYEWEDASEGVFIITDIPAEFDGKYAYFYLAIPGSNDTEVIFGCQSIDESTFEPILVQISNGKVNMAVWILKDDGDVNISKYNGNQTFTFDYDNFFFIYDSSTPSSTNLSEVISFTSITFSNGSVTKSWNDGFVP